MTRILIVNADDFGLSVGVNRGVIEAHELGIVTSASLMVRQPAASMAAAYGQSRPTLSLGLHVDLGEWRYEGGTWVPIYELEQVEPEIDRQLNTFRSLVGRDPTHLDSHQHVHRAEPVRTVLLGLTQRLGVPLRECNELIAYCGSFFGQTGTGEPIQDAVGVSALQSILRELRDDITELGCHPGYANGLSSSYRVEREQEVETLCHPLIRKTLATEQIELSSFREALG